MPQYQGWAIFSLRPHYFFPGHQKGLSGWWREKKNDDDDSALFRPKLDSPMLHKMYPKYAFGLFSKKKNYWKKLKISLSKSNVEFRFSSFSHPCFLDLITSASFVRTSRSLFECVWESGGTKKRERKILHRVKDAKRRTQAIFPAKKQQKNNDFCLSSAAVFPNTLRLSTVYMGRNLSIYFFLGGGGRGRIRLISTA